MNQKNKTLNNIIYFCLFAVFFLLISQPVLASCASVSMGGDYAVSASCTFAGTVDGVDNGNITVNTDQTLTVGAGQTIVWGPGKSLVINGSIAINSTGQLKQTRLWVKDSDGDGYPTTDTPIAQTDSPGAGYVYRNQVDVSITYTSDMTYDTNDTSITVYPGTTCNGDCSINNDDGTCGAKTAGEYGLATCKRCDGNSLTSVNIANNTRDLEGSNLCNQTCQACQSGSCGNANAGTDPGNHCAPGVTDADACKAENCVGTSAACAYQTSGESNCSRCNTCVGATSFACKRYANGLADAIGPNTCSGGTYKCNYDVYCCYQRGN